MDDRVRGMHTILGNVNVSFFVGWLLLLIAWAPALRAVAAEQTAADPDPQSWATKVRAAMRASQWDDAQRWIRQELESHPDNARAHLLQGQWMSAQGRGGEAVAELGQAIQLDADLVEAYQLRGSERFKLGQIEDSLKDFDAYLARSPGQAPYHWQRGIAYYYAGRFEEGRRQFELHQTVNAQDVENAVWHFLCVSRVSGVKAARDQLIPIQGDTRVPMREVHELFAGTGTPERVLEAANRPAATPAAARLHKFYAHLYLGLYFEAIGDAELSRSHILKAADLSDSNNYMGAVARVHAQRLKVP